MLSSVHSPEASGEINNTRGVNTCQQENARGVTTMEKSSFGERLRQAFQNANNAQIARKIAVSPSAVVNYMAGRVPELEKLLKIKAVTGCDLDWLITGQTSQGVELSVRPRLMDRLRTIAADQAHELYGDADIAGNVEERALAFVTEFLIYRALLLFGLVEETDILTKPELARAKRLTFAENVPGTIDDRIRELIRREGGNALGAADNKLRDIIREIVAEEVGGRKVPVYDLDLGSSKEKTRKAG